MDRVEKSAEKCIKITNRNVIAFYEENKHLDINSLNLLFIEIMKSLSSNLTSKMTSTVNSRILDIVTEMSNNMNTLKMEMVMKLHESKKEYMDDIRLHLSNTSLSSNEKITGLIERSNENLMNKTKLLISELIPETQKTTSMQLENQMRSLCGAISADTQKLVSLYSKDEGGKQQFTDSLEDHLNKMITTMQQPIFSVINNNNDRSLDNFNALKESLTAQKEEQLKLSKELNDFLNRYKNNSQVKGNVGETELMQILMQLMPSDEIIRVSNQTAACDVRVNRHGGLKPTILFECKDYVAPVDRIEVAKFERDLQEQKCHGVLVSCKTGISLRKPFEISIINGLIHVYVPFWDFSVDKLKVAIDIIDNLHMRLLVLEKQEKEGNIYVTSEDYDELLREFNEFADMKNKAIEMLNEFTKKLKSSIESIQLPRYGSWFTAHGSLEAVDLTCAQCRNFIGKNRTSLAAHMRRCRVGTVDRGVVVEDVDLDTNVVNVNVGVAPIAAAAGAASAVGEDRRRRISRKVSGNSMKIDL
jgi:hypothetical protein